MAACKDVGDGEMNEFIEPVARALCLAQFGDAEIHGDARCCQVGGTDGCCLLALRTQAMAAIDAVFATMRKMDEGETPNSQR
jgi:hypothetical protein